MEELAAHERFRKDIRRKLGIKGDADPSLSVGLVKKMHQLIQDGNLSHIQVGRSVGLNERESNKFLSHPHLKTFSKDKFGKVRMLFSHTDQAKAEVRRLYEQHNRDVNAVAFVLGVDRASSLDRLLGKTKLRLAQKPSKGMHVNVAGSTYRVKDLIYPPKSKGKR